MMTYKEFIEKSKLVQFELVFEDNLAKDFLSVVRTPIGLWSRRETFSKPLLNDLGDKFAESEMTFKSVKAAYNKYVTDLAQS